MNRIKTAVVNGAQKATAAILATQHSIERRVTATPAQRRLFQAVYGLTFGIALLAPSAHAQQSWADAANTAGQTVDAGKALLGKCGMGLAVFLVISGGLLMKKRSDDGPASQVKAGAILGCFLAAVVCGAAGAILYKTGASIGVQTSDYGSVPN